MKLTRSALIVLPVVVSALVGGALATGCASGSEAKRSEARGSAGTFRDSLTEMPPRIDQTMSQLLTLSDNRTTDKSKPLSEFRKGLKAMDGDARSLGAEADEATKDADAYFKAWEREALKDPAKRQSGGQTVAAKKASYQTAQQYLQSARQRYFELTDNLHNIDRLYTAGNVDSTDPAVRTLIDKAGENAAYVKNYIARLGEQIDATLGVK